MWETWATTQTKKCKLQMSSVNLNYSLIQPLQPQYSFPFLPVGAAGVWRRYNDALSWPSHTHTHTRTHAHTHTHTQNHSCNASFPPHSNPWNQDMPRPLFSLHSLSLCAHSRCVELDTAVTTETVLVVYLTSHQPATPRAACSLCPCWITLMPPLFKLEGWITVPDSTEFKGALELPLRFVGI